MNRTTVALLAALEAVIVVAIGLAICLVPLTVMWAVQYHLGTDWFVFWRAGADIWLVGHGVNLTVALDAQTTAALGFTTAIPPFQVTIAALGFAALTAGLGVRTGIRAGETPFPLFGGGSALVAFAVLSTIVAATAGSGPVRPSVWQGIILPPFVYALGIVFGLGLAAARRGRTQRAGVPEEPSSAATAPLLGRAGRVSLATAPAPAAVIASVRTWSDRVPRIVRERATAALRAGSAAAALVVGVSALILALLIFGNYGAVIGLYEQLQAGALGGAALTIAQLAFLPNLVIWLASWMIGPGFALGSGSSVSPLGTELGPLPGLPLFAVIPAGGFAFGLVGIVVPLVCGFVAATLIRARSATLREPRGARALLLTAVGIGVVAGIELGLLAWWSSGALGPGRLHDVGPNPWLVGVCAAVEVAVAAAIGLVAGGARAPMALVSRPSGRR